MLAIDDPDRQPPSTILDSPGGFLWWYADGINADGDGFVCIWSWGLPFLPGRAGAARRGQPIPPRQQPSINLALYEGGRQVAYHLLTVGDVDPSPAAMTTADGWRWGDSTFRRPDPSTLHAELTLPVPGSPDPLRATFTLAGPPARWVDAPSDAAPHRWTPLLGPATAHAHASHAGRPLLDLRGTGYHDRNASPAPLDQLGMDHWIWGRAQVGDELVILYLSWPSDPAAAPHLWLVRGAVDGTLRARPVRVRQGLPARAAFGMTWWPTLVLDDAGVEVRVDVDPPADDGPFYLRCRIRVTVGAQTGHGWAELCRPDRVDPPLLRPLVAMVVQGPADVESRWLPLFAGPHAGRWSRLGAWWRSGRTLGRGA